MVRWGGGRAERRGRESAWWWVPKGSRLVYVPRVPSLGFNLAFSSFIPERDCGKRCASGRCELPLMGKDIYVCIEEMTQGAGVLARGI